MGIIDLKGQKFGRLLVLNFSHTNKKVYWLCKCDCGTKHTVRGNNLKSGRVTSCGCYLKELLIKNYVEKTQFLWKGNKVKLSALHTRMRKRVPKRELCQFCNKSSSFDLANKSQEYKTTVDDWMWLCKSCHRRYDNGWKWIKNEWWKICKPCGKNLKICKENFWERNYKDGKKFWFSYCKKCCYKMVKPYKEKGCQI